MNEKKSEESMIRYWSPSDMMRQMEKAFSDLRMGMENYWYPRLGVDAPRFPMVDIIESEGRYLLDADLPGMSKEDVDIEVGMDHLVIKAEKSRETEEKKEGYVRKERGQTSFYRKVPIPPDADKDQISARLENGVLRVTIPKAEPAQKEEQKKVKVE